MKCRVMTYNVHGCRGTDGQISVKRIAEVIAEYKPDIVALQELDLGRARSDEKDQPHLIAKELGMKYHFHAPLQVEEEQYGNAILSTYPMRLEKSAKLVNPESWRNLEPRGAMWVIVQIGNTVVQVFNTHLGLNKEERRHHVKQLLGNNWLRHASCAHPVIFCGDFNARSTSKECHLISQMLNDVQMELEHHRPKATWSSYFPFFRIDHIYVSPGIEVTNVDVPRTPLNRKASDHLPLIVDLSIPGGLDTTHELTL